MEGLADLNRQAAHGVVTLAAARRHQTIGTTPTARRAADVAALTSWRTDLAFAFGEHRPRRVPRDGFVRRLPPGLGLIVSESSTRGLFQGVLSI